MESYLDGANQVRLRHYVAKVEDPTRWVESTTALTLTTTAADPEYISGRIVPVNGDGTGSASSESRVVSLVSIVRGADVVNTLMPMSVALSGSGLVSFVSNPTAVTGTGFESETEYAIIDAETMDPNGATQNDHQLLITMRNVHASGSINYKFLGAYWQGSGTVGSIPIDASLNSAIAGGDINEARVGVNATGGITDYAKAARMPKITLSNKEYFSDGDDTLVGVNVPDHSGSGTVAILVGRATGNAANSSFQLWKGKTESRVTHDVNDGNCVKVLFSQTELTTVEIAAGEQPEDQINLVMSNGHVHVYKYSASQGVVSGIASS